MDNIDRDKCLALVKENVSDNRCDAALNRNITAAVLKRKTEIVSNKFHFALDLCDLCSMFGHISCRPVICDNNNKRKTRPVNTSISKNYYFMVNNVIIAIIVAARSSRALVHLKMKF